MRDNSEGWQEKDNFKFRRESWQPDTAWPEWFSLELLPRATWRVSDLASILNSNPGFQDKHFLMQKLKFKNLMINI